jgi:hypothetical protein
LEDVKGASFTRINAPHVAGVPAFVLKDVEGFSVMQSKPLPDTELDHVDRMEILVAESRRAL